MNAKRSEIQLRKDLILGIVVNRYIQTVQPCGSHFIAEEYDLDVSPATIRNILAELEEDGYLSHPHTSAGRVPTQQGYRFYVNYLMKEIDLLAEEKRRIEHEYARDRRELETLLEKTSEVVSDLTHYTTIMTLDGWDNKLVLKGASYVVGYSDTQDLQRISKILRVLEEKETILELLHRNLQKKVQIYIGHEMAMKDMESCAMAVSRFTKRGASGRIAVLGPTRMNYERVVSALDYVSEVLSERL